MKRNAGMMVVMAALLVGACASDGKGGADGGSGGGAGTTGGGGAAGGRMCGQTRCGLTQFCDMTPNTCAGGSGFCDQRPLDCLRPEQKVCGCDGNVYRSECDAQGAGGVDVSDVGGCTPPAGTFSCGSRFCTQGTEYCAQTETLGSPVPSSACRPLPSACGATPTCACVAPECCSSITLSASGDLTTLCAQL